MNRKARYFLLLPFSTLYGCITSIRNRLYDNELLTSAKKNIPIVVVGNITVGGTGKTPHTEFIIEKLSKNFNLAVLSRGYKRHSTGFVAATPLLTARELGDEPKQMALRFPSIPIAVCENRSKGIDRLQELHPELDCVVLDDAFQHRRIKPGYSIVLTDYNRLHTRDSLLPGGNLRESAKGSQRAHSIIVTKCRPNLSSPEMDAIAKELKISPHQQLFFSSFVYGEIRPLFPAVALSVTEVNGSDKPLAMNQLAILVVTGIVSPQLLTDEFKTRCNQLHTLHFPDHHDFSLRDFARIEQKFKSIVHPHKLILTTEKDAARLINNPMLPDSIKKYIFVVPVKVQILNDREKVLIQNITDYVRENSGNRRIPATADTVGT